MHVSDLPPSDALCAGSHTQDSTTGQVQSQAQQPPRKQIIGFAKFATRADALYARDVLQSKRVDAEKSAVLKAEMAKKNLHTKRGVGGPSGNPAPSGLGAQTDAAGARNGAPTREQGLLRLLVAAAVTHLLLLLQVLRRIFTIRFPRRAYSVLPMDLASPLSMALSHKFPTLAASPPTSTCHSPCQCVSESRRPLLRWE